MLLIWAGLFVTLVLAILTAMFIRAIFVPLLVIGLVVWGLYAVGIIGPEPPPKQTCFVQSGCG